MNARQLVGTLAPGQSWPIYTATATKDGGRYIRTFTGPRGCHDAESFRREQESYGCTVDVKTS